MAGWLQDRVLWTDLDAWNNPWYVYLGAPVLAALGAMIGTLFGVHLVSGEVGEWLVIGGCIAGTMLVGFALLAVLDRDGEVT